jgi:hypothetical protein
MLMFRIIINNIANNHSKIPADGVSETGSGIESFPRVIIGEVNNNIIVAPTTQYSNIQRKLIFSMPVVHILTSFNGFGSKLNAKATLRIVTFPPSSEGNMSGCCSANAFLISS